MVFFSRPVEAVFESVSFIEYPSHLERVFAANLHKYLRSPCTVFCEVGGGGIDVRLRNKALGPNSGLARPKPICDQSVFFVLISGEKMRTLRRLFASVPDKECSDSHGKKAACRLHKRSLKVYVKNIMF
jgi:hypothetical protein